MVFLLENEILHLGKEKNARNYILQNWTKWNGNSLKQNMFEKTNRGDEVKRNESKIPF